MAQQKTIYDKQKQDELEAQYQREQDMLSNRLVFAVFNLFCSF